jgi:cobalt-zinc-cadmium efflux system membrane fusion protein
VLIAAIVFVAVLLAVMGRWWLSSRPADGAVDTEAAEPVDADALTIDRSTQEAIGLKVQAAESRTLAERLDVTGVVAPNETRVAHVRVLAAGRVEQVHVRLGDRVATDQPLVTYDNIDVGELAGDYLAAVAAIDRAAAEVEVARRALERAGNLVEIGGLARAEYERRDAERQRALSEVATANATLANIERRLRRFGLGTDDLSRLRASSGDAGSWSTTVVRAPFAGVITAADVGPGEVVDPERELFTLADLSTVWVIGDVYQRDIASIRPGQQAAITTESYPDETFAGRITYVSDVLDPQTRTAKVRTEVPNRDGRLKLQMFVRMHLPTATSRDTLAVPAAAVQEVDNNRVVFVQTGDETFEKRVIEVGPTDGTWIAVTAGLRAGERVVTDAAFMLKSKLKAASIGEGEEGEGEGRR